MRERDTDVREAMAVSQPAQPSTAQTAAADAVASATTAQRTVAKPETVASVAPQPIPFRAEREVGGGELIGALSLVVLVLAAVSVALHQAQRRGLLARWLPGLALPRASAGDTRSPSLAVERAVRISPRTVLYRVRDGERLYLLVESQAQARLYPADAEAEAEAGTTSQFPES